MSWNILRNQQVSALTLIEVFSRTELFIYRKSDVVTLVFYKSGLLTPVQRESVELKAWKYKEKLPDKLLDKENVLKTTIGRGLLLISVSLIRHRCWKLRKKYHPFYQFFFSFYEDLKRHYRRVMNIEDTDSEDDLRSEEDDDDYDLSDEDIEAPDNDGDIIN